jgi:hypothetical protein
LRLSSKRTRFIDLRFCRAGAAGLSGAAGSGAAGAQTTGGGGAERPPRKRGLARMPSANDAGAKCAANSVDGGCTVLWRWVACWGYIVLI